MGTLRAALRGLLLVGVIPLVVLVAASAAASAPSTPDFADVSPDHRFAEDIAWIASQGVTQGCAPSQYCPDHKVTRGQMAAFISRALGLSDVTGRRFSDVPATHVFATEIDRFAAAGITQGCTADRFCPERGVTRAEMAAFLSRALDLTHPTHPRFVDVPADNAFATDINRIADVGITQGCSLERYCPMGQVSRAHMAAFLRRALEPPAASRPDSPDPDGDPETSEPEVPAPDSGPGDVPEGDSGEQPESAQEIGSHGALPNGEARYPVPPNAIFVAPWGSDGGDGSASTPLATVTEAIRRAPVDGTIVLRGGSYHQRFTLTKRLTIQNYPGEEVWFDGSRHVTSWRASGGAWIHDGWDIQFDASPTYSWGAAPDPRPGWGFVSPDYPMAAHPDQVWVDDMPQQQVASRSEVTAGTFYVDYAAKQLILGTNPAGRYVRASAIARAIEVRANDAVLRGFGVRRYAPSIPHIGTITAERPGAVLENLHVTDNATTGLALLAADQRATRITSVRNGMLGVAATYADGLVVEHLRAASNNLERFNMAPVAGGMKIGRSRVVSIGNSRFDGNLGTGLWLDESVYHANIANSVSAGNRGHGLSLEISARMVVAGNLIRDNARFGIKVNNTSDVEIWNNTIIDNGRPVNIVQDGRRLTSSTSSGRDPRQPFPDPTMTWINGPVAVHNNVVSGTTGNCLVCVEDYSGEFSAEAMGVATDANIYSRVSVTAPRWFAVWSRGAGNPAVFYSLGEFQRATGQEARSLAFDGIPVVTADGQMSPELGTSTSSVALPLPATVAQLVGQPTGSRQVGAFLAE
jgi:trimeric autotransporter adhesin